MPSFKHPDLPPGALRELIDALHALHLEAGYPSTRTLEDDLGGAGVSHTTIHKVFTTDRLPRWSVVDVLVGAMARRAGRDERGEIERIHNLWTSAAQENEKPGPRLKLSKTEDPPEMAPDRSANSLAEVMTGTLDEIEAIGSNKGTKNYRVPTGFDDLDALVGGWTPGGLVVIGGRPSSGRTSLMLNFSTTASYKNDIASMFISTEEDSHSLVFRVLSSVSKVPLHFMRVGQLTDDDWNRLARGMLKVVDAPIFFNASKAPSLDDVVYEAKVLARRFKLRLLLIDDFLSVVERSSGDVTLGMEGALSKLKDLARKLNITVIVGVPTARRENEFAKIDTRLLPENAIFERLADIIVILDRPDQDEPESPRAGEADLWVAKNRYGPQASVLIAFQGHYARFVDISVNQYPIFPTTKTADSTPDTNIVNDAPSSADDSIGVKDRAWDENLEDSGLSPGTPMPGESPEF